MQRNPLIQQLVDTMQQDLQSSPKTTSQENYFENAKTVYKKDGTTHEQKSLDKAIEIATLLSYGTASPAGTSIRSIQEKFKQVTNPEQFLANERHKTLIIKEKVQHILDTEFEPEEELQYNKERDLFYQKIRERKVQSFN